MGLNRECPQGWRETFDTINSAFFNDRRHGLRLNLQQAIRKLKWISAVAVLAIGGPALASESAEFDVPAGSFQTLFSGILAPETFIKCEFEVEPPVHGDRWLPSVAIIFESEEQIENGGAQARLTAIGSLKERGWRHQLSFYRGGLDRKAEINVHTGVTDSVMQLNMKFTAEDSVVFFVGKEPAEYSELDIAPAELTKWSVVAVGVTGTGSCDEIGRGAGPDRDDLSTRSAHARGGRTAA